MTTTPEPLLPVVQGDELRDLIAKATQEDLSDGGRYFRETYTDLTRCRHEEIGEYQHRHNGPLIEWLWNHRAEIADMYDARLSSTPASAVPDASGLREALEAALAKRSVPTMDPVWSAAFNAALDMVARDVATFSPRPTQADASDAREVLRRVSVNARFEWLGRDDCRAVLAILSRPTPTASDMAAFGASETACILYPGEHQHAERAAFCEGAARSVTSTASGDGVGVPAGWRTIDSAPAAAGPEDTRILVIGGAFDTPQLVLPDGDWWRKRAAEGGKTFTHWMHVPPAPLTAAPTTGDGE